MSEPLAPEDTLTAIRREIERNALRARNGLKYLAGSRFATTNVTPRELVWERGKAKLWRYRGEQPPTRSPPVLIYVGLAGRARCFDLLPGNSFVGKILAAGFDASVLDWGEPDEADAGNTFATYGLDYIPSAVDALLDATGERELSIVGYCMGACMTLLSLGAGSDLPVRALVLMAAPIDFTQMGEMLKPIRDGSFDPDDLIDETGNVPASTILASFRVRRPTSDLLMYANLWENLWNDAYVEGFQAMNEFANDHVPLPGAAFREMVSQWIIGNGFVNNTLRVGTRAVDLGRIRCPVLCVMAEKDDIVPLPAAAPLPALLTGAASVDTVLLPAGHVNLVMGRPAEKVTIPKISEFLARHGSARKA